MLGRPSLPPHAGAASPSSSARSGKGSVSATGAGRVPESPFYRRPSAMAPPQGRKSSMPTTLPSAAELNSGDVHSQSVLPASPSPWSTSSQYQSQARASTTPKPAASGSGFLARPTGLLSNASSTSLHSQATPSRLLSRSSSISLANGNTLAMSASVPDLRSAVSSSQGQSRTSLHILSPVPEARRASTTAAATAAPETPTPLSRRTSGARADGKGPALPSRSDDRTPRPSDRLRSSRLGAQQQQQEQPSIRPSVNSSKNAPPPPTTPSDQRTGSNNLTAHPPLRMSMSMASLPSRPCPTSGKTTSASNGYSHSMNAARESVSRYLDAAADLAQDSATGFASEMSVESLRDENLELKLKLIHYERNMSRDHLDLVNQNIVLTKRVLELQRDLTLAKQNSTLQTHPATAKNELDPSSRTRTSTISTLTASSMADSDSGSVASGSTSTNTSPTSMIRVSADPAPSALTSVCQSLTAIAPLSGHHDSSQEATPRRDAPRGQVPATPPAVRSHDVFTTPPVVTAHNGRPGGIGTGVPTRMALVSDPGQIDEEVVDEDQVNPSSPLLHRTTMSHVHAHTTPRPPSYLSHHRASIDSQASTMSATAAAAATCPLPPSSPTSPASMYSQARRDSKSSVYSAASTASFASQCGLDQQSAPRSPSPHSTLSASTSSTADADTSMADLDRAFHNLSMTESIHLMQPLAGMAHVPDSPEPNRILSPPLSSSMATPRPPQTRTNGLSDEPSIVRPLRTRLFADHPAVAATTGRRPSADVSGPPFLRSPTLAPLTCPSSTSLAGAPTSPAMSEHEEIQVLTQTAADRILGLGTSSATPTTTRRPSASMGTEIPAALATPPGLRPSRRSSEATSTGALSPPTSPQREAVEYAPMVAPLAHAPTHAHVRPAHSADESILSDNTLFMFSGEESDATTLDQMALAEDEDRVIKLVAPPPARVAGGAMRRQSLSGPMVVARAKAMGAAARATEFEESVASGIEDQSWVFAEEGNEGE